ncbi:hypothetical protein TrVE_jg4308 [Triparma verrucosa]|uniref:Transmembrane protein n=1 Tax=Triparma verrucosa TaxID=1606542 RepID=A0A9W7C465_9STRA|nr:hypothetical protein TrVE_jg4308 [Triparma verrucosa]
MSSSATPPPSLASTISDPELRLSHPPPPNKHREYDIQALSPFYEIICLCTSLTAPALCIDYATNGTQPDSYAVMLPVQASCCCLQFCMRPRSRNPAYSMLLSINFFCLTVLSEVMLCVGNAKAGIFLKYLPYHILRSILWSCCYQILLVVRRQISRLNDEDLNDFLIEKVMIQGGSGLIPILLLTFESFGCILEEDDSSRCEKNINVQVILGSYFTLYMVMNVLSGIIPKHVLARHTLLIEEVALFGSMSLQRQAESFCILVSTFCGIFLLANLDHKNGRSSGSSVDEVAGVVEVNTINIVEGIGFLCLAVALLWNSVTIALDLRILNAEEMKEEEEEEEKEVEEKGEDEKEGKEEQSSRPQPPQKEKNRTRARAVSKVNNPTPIVSEVGDAIYLLFTGLSLIYPALSVLYAVNLDDRVESFANIVFPFAYWANGIAFIMKPLRTGKWFMRSLVFVHLFFFFVFTDLVWAYIYLVQNDTARALWVLARIFGVFFPSVLVLKQFRTAVGRMPKPELSHFCALKF